VTTLTAVIDADLPVTAADDSHSQLALWLGESSGSARHSKVPKWFDEENGDSPNTEARQLFKLAGDLSEHKHHYAE
jgi:hypothetical protein